VDENIPNLKVGICTYEPVQVNFSGPYVGNITEVVYAGFNSAQNNNSCGQGNFATSIVGVNPAIVTINTAPPVGYSPAHGNGAGSWGGIMIGASGQCDTTQSAGGVNTPDEIVYYFENALNANLYFHWSQNDCWLNETKSLSEHGNCCISYQPAALANYTWNIPGVGQQLGSSWDNNNATLSNDGAVSLIIEQDGCVSATITADVQVNPIPNITIQQVEDYCVGETAVLDAISSVGGSSFVWTGPGGFISNADPVVFSNAQVSQSGNYSAVASAEGCVSAPLDLILVVHDLPQIDIVVADNSVCLGQSINLSVTGAVSAIWNGIFNGLTYEFLGINSADITVVGTDEFGCSNAAAQSMTVHQPSISIFQAAPAHPELEGYLGGYYPLLTQLMANGNAESFLWDFGDTTSSLFTDMPDTIYHIYENPGQFMLIATAEIDGCFAYDTVWIETFAESLLGCDADIENCLEGEIPSVVTPNGDGNNDYFWIPNRFMQEWEVKVFNRWGTLMFTIDTPNQERMVPVQYWDPKDVNGGVYYYTYQGKGVDYIDYQSQGYFQVVK
jgi:gliding motility-associated-like protein